mmetsp:Transcript_45306/g.72414  ORF Transcript_45306/g.72414 Transcript_45306/m.72414 type:complete len:287 (-) Transcript_45306:326-1186(-)|eukprot:CAMPEP_0197030970 /NCGR_PEP_ID=MMETSP1384-20130603/10093_1 /TAXON_ID=29189 /ORGANISM="Ammonia sp." /LENGTH=286 /DNA_ID=CAMNT_0042460413 /DNA_START=48 /DNA_END=908 /DNA_ORIENTATION=+
MSSVCKQIDGLISLLNACDEQISVHDTEEHVFIPPAKDVDYKSTMNICAIDRRRHPTPNKTSNVQVAKAETTEPFVVASLSAPALPSLPKPRIPLGIKQHFLICGYIRKSTTNNLHFPREIIQMIQWFHADFYQFDTFDRSKFKVSEYGTVLRGTGIGDDKCYTVYASSLCDPDRVGVHVWSINTLKTPCSEFDSLGIQRKFLSAHRYSYQFETQPSKWREYQIFTVVLDYQNCVVSFYRNSSFVSKYFIKKRSFHFVLNVSSSKETHIAVLQTPQKIKCRLDIDV